MDSKRWRQVEQVYHAALEREPEQRSAFLSEQCQSDEDLRREVESLLAQDAADAGVLERPAWEGAAGLLSGTRVSSLAPATQLGPYQIEKLIGRGGMGEVYKAHDTRLGRVVAIKVSAKQFSTRFEREARAISALNHPNVCTLYDVGTNYLVMELVEGEAISGPLPLEDALAIALQIAAALEAAHERGIVHRDLKPANIKVKPEGMVKVLDFGLAKQLAKDPGDKAGIPETMAVTDTGIVVGTAAYMSPEQAQGKTVDKRADIWAFGVILYELLTGTRLFKAETFEETLAAVMTREPDWEAVPAKARPLLKRCLVRDPKRRLRDIGEAEAWLQAGSSDSPIRSAARWKFAVAALIVIAVGALAMALHPIRAVEHPLQPLVRLDVDLGPDVTLGGRSNRLLAISPDGTLLAYVSQGRLFIRRLDQSASRELPEAKGAEAPFFSPDNQWVGFVSGRKLQKIRVVGGSATVLCDALHADASWGDDDKIVASLSGGRLWRISAAGGAPTAVTEIDPQLGDADYEPHYLPGGAAILFTVKRPDVNTSSIEVLSFANGRRKTLVKDGSSPHYLHTGHLVYLMRQTLYAVRFDLAHLEVSGPPIPVLEDANPTLAFSRTGTAVYLNTFMSTISDASGWATDDETKTIQSMDAAGNMRLLLARPAAYMSPRLSPDGTRIAMSLGSNIWVYDSQRSTMRQLTFEGGDRNSYPIWTPDGRYILYRVNDGIAWTRSDGSGKPGLFTSSKHLQWPWSFSPDGRRVAFFELTPDQWYDIWTVPVESDDKGLRAGTPQRFLNTPTIDERYPSFSPDGRWLAYSSNALGTYEVWVQALSVTGGRWRISMDGGVYPEWSKNGRELFFRGEDNRIMVASYSVKGDSFVADTPRAWSEKKPMYVGPFDANFDVAPDGKHIIALMPAGRSAPPHVTFLINFSDEIRRRTENKER
jgi:Tol biopolymer transport system component